jgi:hypothetical protein
MTENGMTENGMTENGMTENGMTENGARGRRPTGTGLGARPASTLNE